MVAKKAKLVLDKRRAKKDGSFPIVIEIRNNDKIRIATSYSSIPENWVNGMFGKKESNYSRKNVILNEMQNNVERILLELSDNHQSISDKDLRDRISRTIIGKEPKKEKTFVEYLDEFVSIKSNKGTQSVYATTRSKIEKFDPNCTFESMDKKWLTSLESWMAQTMKINAYAIHLRNIRAVFNYAIDEEYTTLYPFRKFKIKKEETRKRSLTVEQLAMLRDYDCEEYQKRYRDLFMLMFYLIGINAADLFNAKPAGVVDGRIEYKRAKTGKLYSIKIEPEALVIIERYKGREYLLNIMDEYSNHKDFLHRMGTGLKQIGECKRVGLGGKKEITPLFPDISSYWARHTWATIAHKIGVPKDVISMALGHSFGVATTDIYINYDNDKIDEANRMVIDYVNEAGPNRSD
ncbi:site-specific integrase [Bacteroides reticulotermitis]|uniref:Tyrosine type site-specific recombinase n=2 Tax=Bacteroides reticulotermitis TaxID=1133319 RepID=W4URQ0_9BACE|nr:site-specific integrase [Bacteroides reticulotermitis]MBB4043788.1 site-specific recombinase XerD [Bacteroides reticulotermitis]GAE83313.1 tyrosine type site-specific recombinase [Bacteroides reticulotermitis JCM 10512]